MYFNKYDSAINQILIFIQSIFFKIIGLSPWTISVPEKFRKKRKSHNDQNYKCSLSYVGIFYNIVIFIVGISFILSAILNNSLHAVQEDQFITSSVAVIIFYVSAFTFCGLFLLYTIKQKSIINAINRLVDVDEKFLKCGAYKLKSNKTIFILFSVNFVLNIHDVTSIINSYPLLTALVFELPVVINSWIIIQYIIILDVIIKRFEMINLAVSKLQINNYTTLLSQPQSVVNLSILHRELVLYDIGNFKYAYIELVEICQDVGEFFGLFILIIIIYSGVWIIYISYFLIMLINEQKIDIMEDRVAIIWIGWITSEFILLTTYVNKTEKESQKTAGILSATRDRCTADEELKHKLFLFSHAISHRTIEFNVCDIIPLNRSLLQTMAGTVVTYLIILIQFRNCTGSH